VPAVVKPVRRYTAARRDRDQLLNGPELRERPEPAVPAGWTTATLKAAPLNHHDLWTLEGVGIREEQQPMILGCDAAGDEVVHRNERRPVSRLIRS